MLHEPYDENKLKHQEPVGAISQWQEYNDPLGIDALHDALMDEEAEQRAQEMNRVFLDATRLQ